MVVNGVSSMPKERKGKRKAIDVTLPQGLIKQLDEVAGELDATRSYVIETMLKYAMENIDEIFPYQEVESEEETEEEES